MEHEEADDSVVFFTRMGISVKTIMKMEAAYGEAMISMVKENPYRLIEEIDGIGFKTADKLAKELAFAEDHPYRIKAVILSCVLDLCMASGDTYTTLEQIQKRFCKEFDASVEIAPYLEELELDRLIMIEAVSYTHLNVPGLSILPKLRICSNASGRGALHARRSRTVRSGGEHGRENAGVSSEM